jgi:hypothetical protein
MPSVDEVQKVQAPLALSKPRTKPGSPVPSCDTTVWLALRLSSFTQAPTAYPLLVSSTPRAGVAR